MRNFIKIVESATLNEGAYDTKFTDENLYLSSFTLADFPKFVKWSLTKLTNPVDVYRRARMVLKLPPIDIAVHGLTFGIDDLYSAKKIVMFVMKDDETRKDYKRMGEEAGIPIYYPKQSIKRITAEEAEPLFAYHYVSGEKEVPNTDDWEYFIAPNPPGMGAGKVNAELVISHKHKVRRFPTAGEYYGIFQNNDF